MSFVNTFSNTADNFLYKIYRWFQEWRTWNVPAYGRKGFRVVESGTNLPAGENYGALLVIADANIDITPTVGDSDTGVAIQAGTVIPVPFDNTGLTVNSGTVYAFIEK
jgi:hypothetical protein